MLSDDGTRMYTYDWRVAENFSSFFEDSFG